MLTTQAVTLVTPYDFAVVSPQPSCCVRSLLSLSRRSITLINTQLIHQFVFRHADAVNLVLLRAGITLFSTEPGKCHPTIPLYFLFSRLFFATFLRDFFRDLGDSGLTGGKHMQKEMATSTASTTLATTTSTEDAVKEVKLYIHHRYI